MDDIDDVAVICPVRKRSVEIPLENLLSGIVYLSGNIYTTCCMFFCDVRGPD